MCQGVQYGTFRKGPVLQASIHKQPKRPRHQRVPADSQKGDTHRPRIGCPQDTVGRLQSQTGPSGGSAPTFWGPCVRVVMAVSMVLKLRTMRLATSGPSWKGFASSCRCTTSSPRQYTELSHLRWDVLRYGETSNVKAGKVSLLTHPRRIRRWRKFLTIGVEEWPN